MCVCVSVCVCVCLCVCVCVWERGWYYLRLVVNASREICFRVEIKRATLMTTRQNWKPKVSNKTSPTVAWTSNSSLKAGGKKKIPKKSRVDQSHTCTCICIMYTRCMSQYCIALYSMTYGHIRCTFTFLAKPTKEQLTHNLNPNTPKSKHQEPPSLHLKTGAKKRWLT